MIQTVVGPTHHEIAMQNSLVEMDQLVRYEIAKIPSFDPLALTSELTPGSSEKKIREIIRIVCEKTKMPDYRSRLECEYFGSGPIEPLLKDAGVTEIIMNGRESIWFEKNGRLNKLPDIFLSDLNYRNFIARISRDSGIEANLDRPFADGRWQDCRVHIAIPPASGDEAVLTLRRHPLSPWTFERLQGNLWAKPEALSELQRLIDERKNVLIVGCTGSGKTSVLNAFLSEIASDERVVIIEDTAELKVPNSVSTKLLTRRDPQGLLREIDQSELVRQALRMRPDRLVMGEIRGGEAKDLLMAFATGHNGCFGTLHADSARQALLRLEMLIQLGAPQWSLQAVRTLIWLSVQAIVVVGRTRDGKRKLEGIYQISSLEEIGFLIEKLI